MKSSTQIAVFYSLFAFLATFANLGTQALIIFLFHGAYVIEISILIGTVVGLPIMYFLEKNHIFNFETLHIKEDQKLFILFALMSFLTTLLFWGIEYSFQWLFGTNRMRYLGGALGLTLGYFIKYQLDKRFVFIKSFV